MATPALKPSKTAAKAPPAPHADDEALEAAAPAKKRKRSARKLALLLVLVLGAGAAGASYYLGEQAPEAPLKPGRAKAATAKAATARPPVFVTLEPFTVNLQREDASSQYLQVGLTLKATDESVTEAVKARMPEIRNRVLLLLSSKRASEISTLDGKKALSAELTREIAQPLAGSAAAKNLDSVLFTSFVIQ